MEKETLDRDEFEALMNQEPAGNGSGVPALVPEV
jgi:hypothetical protein